MAPHKSESDYPQEEAERRRDELLGKLLFAPPEPRPKRDRTPVHEYVVLDDKLRVAVIKERQGGRLVADVYRNLDDLRAGRPMAKSLALATA